MGLDNPLHIAILLLVVLLVFGAKRLPELGRSLGEGMRGFKDSISGEPRSDERELTSRAAAPAPAPTPAPAERPAVAEQPPAAPRSPADPPPPAVSTPASSESVSPPDRRTPEPS